MQEKYAPACAGGRLRIIANPMACRREIVVAKKKFERKKLLVEPKTQIALISRLWLYWVSSVITLLALHSIVLAVPRIFDIPTNNTWLQFLPVVIASLMFVPVITYDMLKLTNRLIGPIFRLRRELRRLAAGERVEPLTFRKGDLWYGFSEDFNLVLARLQGTSPAPVDDAPAAAETEDRELVGSGN